MLLEVLKLIGLFFFSFEVGNFVIAYHIFKNRAFTPVMQHQIN